MKNKRIIFSVLLVAVLAGSCTKEFLDKAHDENKVSPTTYWTKPEDAFRTIIGAYSPLKYGGVNGTAMWVPMFGMDPNVTNEGQSYVVYQNFAFFADDGSVGNMYQQLYVGLFRCNITIANVPKCYVGKGDQQQYKTERSNIMGEAYFLRAYYGYQLTSLFNEPPIVRQVFDDNDKYKALTNSTQKSWVDSILYDVNIAIDSLPESWGAADKGRVTKSTAYALRGMVYMLKATLNDEVETPVACYTKADADFKTIIDGLGGHGLIKPVGKDSLDYVYAYLCNYSSIDLKAGSTTYPAENNKESILETQEALANSTMWNPFLDGYGADGSLYTTYFSILGYWNVGARQTFVAKYEKRSFNVDTPLTRDARIYGTVYLPGDTIRCTEEGPAGTFCDSSIAKVGKLNKSSWSPAGNSIKKYMFPMYPYTTSKNQVDPTNHRLITYADILLLDAEVKYQLGDFAAALGYLNELRGRVGLPAKTDASPTAVHDLIVHEREIEKAMETTWPRDLMRWGRTKDLQTSQNFVSPGNYMPAFKAGKNEYLPIPQYEIDHMTEKGLKQNPGW